jgi:hypothetical protein
VTFVTADLDADVAAVTLYRTADGVISPVRTAINLGAVGGFTAFDAEVPQGVPVTYQALQFDASGNQIGYTATVSVTIPAIEPIYAWLSDPLIEGSAIKVVMTDTAGMAPSRTIPGTVYTIGSKAVVLAGQQGPLAGLDMSFYTLSADDDAAVQSLIQQANGIVLLRTMPGFGALIPRALYCFAGSANPTYLDGNGSIWANSVSEVTPSTQQVIQSSASWDDVISTFPDWDTAKAAFATWLDLEQAFDN